MKYIIHHMNNEGTV